MDKELIYKIRELYDEIVLTPKFKEGKLKTDLLDGLEGVLRDIPDTSDKVEALLDPVLDKKIDYEAIQDLNGRGSYGTQNVERLRNCLNNVEIESYRDLVTFATQRQSDGKLKSMRGVRDLGILSLGPVASRLLYNHLNSLGICLFSDGYRPIELEKYPTLPIQS